MKIQNILLSIAAICSVQIAIAQKDTLHTGSTIEAVTVFFQGARVSRSASLSLSPGKHVVVLSGITPQLNPDRIEVSGDGGLTILSVNHRLAQPDPDAQKQQTAPLQSVLDRLEYRLQSLANKRSVYGIEEKLLMDNMNFQSTGDGASVAQIREAADFYRTRLNAIRQANLELAQQIKAAQDSTREINARLNRIVAVSRMARSEVILSVDAGNGYKGEVRCDYFVQAAGWDPLYDFRVSEITDPLTIQYNANVYQTSGEDWTRVAVTLSSGYPDLSGTAPELHPWYINRPSYRPGPARPAGQGAITGRVTDAQSGEALAFANVYLSTTGTDQTGTTTDMDGRYTFKPVRAGSYTIRAEFLGYESSPASAVYVTNNQVRNFDIALNPEEVMLESIVIEDEIVAKNRERRAKMESFEPRYDAVTESGRTVAGEAPAMQLTPSQVTYRIPVPYTIPSNGSDYRIAIKQEKAAALYTYRTLPKYDTDVYLMARIPGWSALNLLSGQSSIYYQGAYTGDAFVDANSTVDTLELSLGRDRSISVSRDGDKNLNDKRILGSNVRESVGWKISVRNNKSVPIRIEVLDQYPLSEVKSVEVERGQAAGATVDDRTGKITWKLGIPPSETRSVSFDYRLKYPVGTQIYR